MERMKHTGDYELDRINMLEQECADLEEENKRLEEENKKLKSDLSECECSMHYENDEVGFWKRECKKLKEELSKYKKQYEHSMGEDDELIYEEGLYE